MYGIQQSGAARFEHDSEFPVAEHGTALRHPGLSSNDLSNPAATGEALGPESLRPSVSVGPETCPQSPNVNDECGRPLTGTERLQLAYRVRPGAIRPCYQLIDPGIVLGNNKGLGRRPPFFAPSHPALTESLGGATTMLDHLLVWVNGHRHEIRGRAAFLSLSDFLRRELGLTGTKIVCSEGDCGACSVLVGRPTASGPFTYRPVDSCILFMFQLDGTHIVTVEGLGGEDSPSAVQQAMVDCHGSQCGFCTPGFVVAMTGLLEERDALDDTSMRCGLTGNLCRCTGYTPILDAGRSVDTSRHQRIEKLYPNAAILSEFAARRGQPITVRAEWDEQQHVLVSPPDLEAALEVLGEHPDSTIVAGATDIGVRINKTLKIPAKILDLDALMNWWARSSRMASL